MGAGGGGGGGGGWGLDRVFKNNSPLILIKIAIENA